MGNFDHIEHYSDATLRKSHIPDYNSMEEWVLSPLTRPRHDQEKEEKIQVDSDVGYGCDFKVTTTTP